MSFNTCASCTNFLKTEEHVYRYYGLPCSSKRQTRSLNIDRIERSVIATLVNIKVTHIR